MNKSGTSRRRKGLLAAALAVPLALGTVAPAQSAPFDEANPPTLEARVKELITVDGLEFKDLNANGELDVYEDWRASIDERVADLVGQMTLEEKAGLMLIDTLNADCEGALPERASQFINGEYMHRFVFRNAVVPNPTCGEGGRSGAEITVEQATVFTNGVQEMSEATRLGIPSLFKSNARNHIDPDARFGINETAGAFSAFPKEAGIAAAALGQGSMEPVEQFAQVMADEWKSIGLRGMYGYMADLATDPRWYRVHETFTEDADLNSDIMKTLVETLQGPMVDGSSLSPDTSVALTLKHFPGGGPQELGLDPHYSFGKTQVYTEGGFHYNLKPFISAIDAGVSSIMPYYGVPINVTYEGDTYSHTGFAFSDEIVNGLLRDNLGFDGYVNSDTGIINDRAWGLEDKTVPERVAAAINGGTDTLSGFNQVQVILDLVDDGLLTEERVDLAAERLLAPMFEMGLFENPYVDGAAAEATVGNSANSQVALDLQRKSLVLLENDNNLLPLAEGTTILAIGEFDIDVVESYGVNVIDGNDESIDLAAAAAEADVALVNLTANNGNARTYDSTNWADQPNNPIQMPVAPGSDEFVPGLDGESNFGESDACVWNDENCTDNGLFFGGSFPWESNILDFTGMQSAESWQVSPSLDRVQTVMNAVGAENTILNVYFRQPYVLDEASGLRDAGAIVARFGASDEATFDVLMGKEDFSGKLPFALPASREAVEQQAPDKPGYDETDDGALYEYAYGLTYGDTVTPDPEPEPEPEPTPDPEPSTPGDDGADDDAPGLPSTGV